ncbi:MAG: permease prefix domain 1-containing protein [Actinomycetaceae bacterium]|nr:permease prefix domain 1-containing protein [Actinomycetaceae bacterium]
MDAIKQYLDYMFRSLPPTPQVMQARGDLLEMMGDKYNELRASGMPEHQAVAQVISDFGDLEEVTSELGIDSSISEGELANPVISVDAPTAEEFLEHRRVRSVSIASGVSLSILAVAALTTFTQLGDDAVGLISESMGLILGFGIGLLFVAVALFLFLNHPYGDEHERLSKNPLALDYDAKALVHEQRAASSRDVRMKVMSGLALLLVTFFMVIVSSVIGDGKWGELGFVLSFAASLVVASIGVWFLVSAGTINNSFKILLEEGDFTRAEKESDPIFAGFAGIYWLGAVLLFLALGFAKNWENADTVWIVWPLAGVLFAIIAVTWSTVQNVRKRRAATVGNIRR